LSKGMRSWRTAWCFISPSLAPALSTYSLNAHTLFRSSCLACSCSKATASLLYNHIPRRRIVKFIACV
jgi:hypothetical protein